MKEVFADTFYWVAVLDHRDPWHPAAVAANTSQRFVLTQAVQLEVMDALSDLRLRPLAKIFWSEVTNNRTISVVPTTDDLLARAVALFEHSADKEWSLTDCISFVVMRDRGITDALTGDRHFVQAGFQALLRP